MASAKRTLLAAIGLLTSPQGMLVIALLAAVVPRVLWAIIYWLAGLMVAIEARLAARRSRWSSGAA